MEATHLVISIEGALAIAAAIVGGAFCIYREAANAQAEFRAIRAADTENSNSMQAQIKKVDDKVDKLGK